MTTLTPSQRLLLEPIRQHRGEWNWYKLGRACLHQLETPAEFTLEPFVRAGLVETRDSKNEPLPRILITRRGEETLDGDLGNETAARPERAGSGCKQVTT